ncbi:MAG TPA: hypothetical protein VFS50_01080 [Meiothermus sp.]|nr:hypothetical protein [Meiothermus sp.]
MRPPWLKVAVVSFALMLAVLYLGQGLPSLAYVILVLGLFLLAFLAMIADHLLQVVALTRRVRNLAGRSPLNAGLLVGIGVLMIVLKLLGVW